MKSLGFKQDKINCSFIWNHNKNDTHTTKSGYSWLIARSNKIDNLDSPSSWIWIWKLQLPENIKFLFWLACHRSVPTLSLLNHINLAQSAICTRCDLQNETFLHCVRDCNHSRILWQQVGFTHSHFFSK